MSTKRILTLAIAALAIVSFSTDAEAQRRRARQTRTTNTTRQVTQPTNGFQQFAQQNRMNCAMHRGKLFIKVDSSKLRQNFSTYCGIGNGKVLEFSGKGHLYTRYNGNKAADFLFGLDRSTFSAPSGKRVSVVVKLNTREHQELDRYVAAAGRNPNREIGSFDYYGGMPKRYYPNSSGTANCTSWISSAKLDGRQSLGRTCGVWDAASPSSWIQSLARNGNDRVQAVLLHSFTGNVNNWREVDSFISSSMAH